MLVLRKHFVLLHSLDFSRAMLTVCGMFRCHRSRSTLSGLCAAFSSRPLPSATAGTGLLSSQNQRSRHILFPADRCGAHLSCYRQSSTSSSVGSDIVGKIQSTHYHLIYTCKVIIEMWLLLRFCLFFLLLWPVFWSFGYIICAGVFYQVHAEDIQAGLSQRCCDSDLPRM